MKNKLFDAVNNKKVQWEKDVPVEVAKIIKENWDTVEKYASEEDRTTKVSGMKFPKEGYWSK